MALTDLMKAFVEHYCDTLSGAKAARLAGYSKDTARQQAYRLLQNTQVQAAIKSKLSAKAMSGNEVLHRLAAMGRGDIADFWTVDPEGKPSFDFKACQEAGLLHLIKKVSYNKKGEVSSVEVYDAQAALVQLGRHHKLFVDQVDLSTKGKPISINTIEVVPPSEGSVDDDPDSGA